jgi:hypothetical protein
MNNNISIHSNKTNLSLKLCQLKFVRRREYVDRYLHSKVHLHSVVLEHRNKFTLYTNSFHVTFAETFHINCYVIHVSYL